MFINNKWQSYKATHDDASVNDFYAGAVAMLNILIPVLQRYSKTPPTEIIELTKEMMIHYHIQTTLKEDSHDL